MIPVHIGNMGRLWVSSVNKLRLSPRPRKAMVMLTRAVTISVRKSMSWRGSDRTGLRGPQAPQVSRAFVLGYTIDVLPPVIGQLEGSTQSNEKNAISTRPSRRKGKSEASAWPATYRRQVIFQRSQRHRERVRAIQIIKRRSRGRTCILRVLRLIR